MRMKTIHAVLIIAVVAPLLMIRQMLLSVNRTKIVLSRSHESSYQGTSSQPIASASPDKTKEEHTWLQADNNVGKHIKGNLKEQALTMDVRWPRRIFFLWCGVKDFTFTNFLSLQSAIRSINPSAVLLAYEFYSNETHAYYRRTWLGDIEETFPFLIKYKISKEDNLCASGKPTQSTQIIRSFLEKEKFLGCLYVAGHTILVEPFLIKDVDTAIDFVDKSTGQGLLYVPTNITQRVHHDVCQLAEASRELPKMCFVLASSHIGKDFKLEPRVIMSHPSQLASQLRLILYGATEYPHHKSDGRNPAPNIGHYVWLGGGKMNYTFFMSVLSILFLGKVHKVYVHGDKPPSGELWQKLQDMDVNNRIQYVPWHRPRAIFGRNVTSIRNQADLVKSSIMWNWGGITMDPDAMFVRPPDPEMFHYDTLLTSGRRATMLNPAIAISKPKSEYARLWLESEKEFVLGKYVWDCCYKMYKIWERKPWIAKIEKQLTIHCYEGYCYPSWANKFAVTNNDVMKKLNDWTKRTVTVHFSQPNPYSSFKDCAFKLGGIAGQLGRMILRASGLLGDNEGLVP